MFNLLNDLANNTNMLAEYIYIYIAILFSVFKSKLNDKIRAYLIKHKIQVESKWNEVLNHNILYVTLHLYSEPWLMTANEEKWNFDFVWVSWKCYIFITIYQTAILTSCALHSMAILNLWKQIRECFFLHFT